MSMVNGVIIYITIVNVNEVFNGLLKSIISTKLSCTQTEICLTNRFHGCSFLGEAYISYHNVENQTLVGKELSHIMRIL